MTIPVTSGAMTAVFTYAGLPYTWTFAPYRTPLTPRSSAIPT
jgi:hypothetical protein